MNNDYDVIVVGSGIGGLTAAGLLSRFNRKRVLVLEQHFTAGGMTHCFKRRSRYEFDVGLHYVGELNEGTLGRNVLDYLTEGRLAWTRMPHYFDRFIYPDFEFAVPADEAEYKRTLAALFPHETPAIERYFTDIRSAAAWYTAAHMSEILPWPARSLVNHAFALFGAETRMTTRDYLDRQFADAKLKALLASQWGDYGLTPAQSCFGIHALIARHYLGGGSFPVGGARQIFAAMRPVIEAAGGTVLTRSRVDKILIRDNRACGVRVSDPYKPTRAPREYFAPIIISDAGAMNTYLRLIPADVAIPFRTDLAAVKPGMSAVTVYIGFKTSPADLGFRGENYWLFSHYDHDRYATKSAWTEVCYLSFPSLKNPAACAHTAEIISFVKYQDFARWSDSRWKHRGADYEAYKQLIADTLLARVEARFPGFRVSIDYVEVSTPLTIETFQASPRGSLYGLPAIPGRIGQSWTRARTPVRNLYLTGTDTMSLGIMGAMMGGVKTAAIINGALGFPRLMHAIYRARRQVRA